MWGWGPWGAPMWGVWWIAPLLGLLFIVVMLVFCARMMRGMMGGGGMCGQSINTSPRLADVLFGRT
jgi:hypothetical protein